MNSVLNDTVQPVSGFPIRTPPDQSMFAAPRGYIAANRVLHRLTTPSHSPYALRSLTNFYEFIAYIYPSKYEIVKEHFS